jgi:biopolymer transport protein ExbD
MFQFAAPRPRRKPSLTPMIDVVFLLLVFFMLAARFGQDTTLALSGAGQGDGYSGPPRLIAVRPDSLALNGQILALDALLDRLATMVSSPDDIIILRADAGVTMQALADLSEALRVAGFARLVLVE